VAGSLSFFSPFPPLCTVTISGKEILFFYFFSSMPGVLANSDASSFLFFLFSPHSPPSTPDTPLACFPGATDYKVGNHTTTTYFSLFLPPFLSSNGSPPTERSVNSMGIYALRCSFSFSPSSFPFPFFSLRRLCAEYNARPTIISQ